MTLTIVASACTPDSDAPSATGDGTDVTAEDGTDVASGEESATTTTEAPVVIALAPDLGLLPGQCFADRPPTVETTTTTTTTTIAGDESNETTTTVLVSTEPTAPTTTLPKPPTLAVVECSGTHVGYVYEALCIGVEGEEPDPIVDRSEQLVPVGCPGQIVLEWPGDRVLRRAAARICLGLFEEIFGEPYATSPIAAREFVPSRGVWEQGDRRMVCTTDQTPP